MSKAKFALLKQNIAYFNPELFHAAIAKEAGVLTYAPQSIPHSNSISSDSI